MTTINNNSLNYEQISIYFEFTIKEAAKKLGICQTILKKNCRKLGIERWPYRKFLFVNNMINSRKKLIMESSCYVIRENISQQIHHYENIKNQLYDNPNMRLRVLLSQKKRQYNKRTPENIELVIKRQKLDYECFSEQICQTCDETNNTSEDLPIKQEKFDYECFSEQICQTCDETNNTSEDIAIKKLIVATAINYEKILIRDGVEINNKLEEYVCINILLNFTINEKSY